MIEERTMDTGTYAPQMEDDSGGSSGTGKQSKQRAMEYLLTYGIAIFAIIAVLGAMTYLGFFSGGPPLGTTCSSLPGFYCKDAAYSSTTGNMTLTFGQDTGYTWLSANVAFVNQSQLSLVQGSGFDKTIHSVSIPGGLFSGQVSNITISVSSPVKKGATRAGYIWAGYTLSGSNSISYLQVATVLLRAT